MDLLLGILLEFIFQLLIGFPGFLWRNFRTSEVERRREAANPFALTSVLSAPAPRAPSRPVAAPGFVTRLGEGTHCQVCGDSLETNFVSCSKCATLHHQDCWTYNGGCSTYGCRRAA